MSVAMMMATAIERDLQDAMNEAQSFWPKNKAGEDVAQKLALVEKDSVTERPYYYVFNRGNNEGFIIISGDSRTKKIIGYSDTGSFDVNNIPEQMRSWLSFYKEELKDLAVQPDSLLKMDYSQFTLSKSKAKGAQTFAREVRPLLGNIKFGQNLPYNNWCPVMYNQRCVTGCVATAGAQVMRYHRYPAIGTGDSHYYDWQGKRYAVTYNMPYDWGNINASYNGSESAAQQNAVAQLLWHIGVSCDMGYTPKESGAPAEKMMAGFNKYFGYDDGIVAYPRNYFTQSEWVYFLKRELNAGRPVVMVGYGGNSGHCFVCDGYDSNDLFHINWGWTGISDGYFSVSYLNPSALGTGGGSGGYNDNVSFFGGIRPPVKDSKKIYMLSVDQVTIYTDFARNARFMFSPTKLQNIGLWDFKGSVGVGLYKNGKFFKLIHRQDDVSLLRTYFYNDYKVTNVQIPADVAPGAYQMALVYKEANDTKWRACMSRNGRVNCVDAQITASRVKMAFNYDTHFTDLDDAAIDIEPSIRQDTREIDRNENVAPGEGDEFDSKPNIQLTNAIHFADNDAVQADEMSLKVDIVNNGSGKYSGKIGAFIYTSDYKKNVGTLKVQPLTLQAGKSQSLNLEGVPEIEPGNYAVALYYVDDKNAWKQVPANNFSCVKFTLTESLEDTPEEYDIVIGENIAPGEEEGDESNAVISGDKESAEADTEEDDEEVVIEKKGGLQCLKLTLQDAVSDSDSGELVYVATDEDSDVLIAKISNAGERDKSKTLYISVFDENDEWVCDLAEKRVTVKAGATKTVSFDVTFCDMDDGMYTVTLMENTRGDYYRALSPESNSTINLDIDVVE